MKLQPKQTIQSTIAVLLVSLLLCSAYAFQGKPADGKAAKTPEQIEADKLNMQVVQLFKEKKFKEALEPAKRAVQLREKALGAEHELTAVSLNNLASIYSELEKHRDAAETRQRLLKVQEALYGPSNIKLSDNLSKLGWEHAVDGKLDAAEEAFKRNLQIREAAYGEANKEVFSALDALAIVSQRRGKNDQSLLYLKRMIAIKEKESGEDHFEVAELLARCAIVLRQANKMSEANQYEARAAVIYQRQMAAGNAPPEALSNSALQRLGILRVPPTYQEDAKKMKIQGSVEVFVTIDYAGLVTDAKAINGPKELRKTSEEAAKQWRFKPTRINGQPVYVRGILTFNYTLQ